MKCEGFSAPCENLNAEKRRQNTKYIDDEDNFKVLCPDCQQESNEHWEDSWNDYYRGQY